MTQALSKALDGHPIVGEVRGFGLLAAMEIVKDPQTRERFPDEAGASALVRDYSIDEGMMMRAVGNTMILSPPLIWTRETIDEAARIVKAAFDRAAVDLLG